MNTSCLNIPALRSASGLKSATGSLSRRAWLGMAGSAAVVTAPGLKNASALLLDRYEVRAERGRVTFRQGSQNRWVIDVRMFAGAPRLEYERKDGVIHILLTGALFPGTLLPADVDATITPALLGSTLRMQFALGSSEGEAGFERWLAGLEPLRLAGAFDNICAFSCPSSALHLNGSFSAVFTPRWSFDCDGDTFADLAAPGMRTRSPLTGIRLAGTGDGSFLKAPTRSRTVLLVRRGDGPWSVHPSVNGRSAVSFVTGPASFDVIQIECAAPARGGIRQVIVAGQAADRALLLASLSHPAPGFTGTLPLSFPQYAVGIDNGIVEHSVIATLAPQPVWLSNGEVGIEVAGDVSRTPFECVWHTAEDLTLRCMPSIRRTLLPLPDAIADASPLRSAKTISLDAGQEVKKANAGMQIGQIAPVYAFALNSVVSVIRPDDFVRIDFEFRNLKTSGSGVKTLVKDDPSKPAFLIAHFPPQHIMERAYFETDNKNFPVTNSPGKPADPDKGKSSDENPPDPPVPSQIAGPSRLVFKVPNNAAPIEYTLKGLLEACRTLPLNVTGPASVLTKKQQSYVTMLQNRAALRSGVSGARQAAGAARDALRDTTPGAAPAKRNVTRGAFKALDDNIKVLQISMSAGQSDRWVFKRIETLRNAAAFEADTDPDLAAIHAASLQQILANVELTGVLAPAAPAISPGLLGQILKPNLPGETDTSLELPSALFMSPNDRAAWMHRTEPSLSDGRVELWHTRLGIRDAQGNSSDGPQQLRTLRALWSPDYNEKPDQGPGHLPMVPYRTSLDRQDRHEVVHLTAGFHDTGFEPVPVNAELLMLSGLGGWMNVVGDWAWPVPPGLSVEHWRHRATLGRDHFVRVVYAGFLFPFGHKASLIKITERKFQLRKLGLGGKAVPVAYLRQRMYIILKEREKIYPGAGQNALPGGSEARRMPYRRIRITTLITPNLDKPEDSDVANKGQSAFWPLVGGTPFGFHCIGEDWEGRPSEFTAPVLFLDRGVTFDGSTAAAALSDYMKWKERRKSAIGGQRVAFADPVTPGDTSFETEMLQFGGEVNINGMSALQSSNDPPFYPTIEEASVHISPAEQLLGAAAAQTIVLDPAYIQNGFDGNKNKGEVFVSLKKELAINFAADSKKSGGLVTPSLGITGLSRKVGAFGGSVSSVATGVFDPMDYFKSALSDAKILGGIPLYTLIDMIPDIAAEAGRMPRMVTESCPEYMRTTLTWTPRLKKNVAPSGSPDAVFDGVFVPKNPAGGLSVTVELRVPKNGSAPVATVRSELKQFELRLLPKVQEFMAIEFNRAVFTIKAGNKVDVDVEIKDLRFIGALSFVNQILTVVDTKGFSDPPFLEVNTSGVTAGYSVSVPTIAVGAFSLQNIALGARLGIPFNGNPLNVGFDFCSRENPFLLTVSLFGGGGFFGISISPRGVEVLEASLEFGGAIALNLGVAKGGVVVMGGFYYMKSSDTTNYEAYVRLGGALAILGLITLSVEFYLGLSYTSNGKMEGKATVKVKIEIAFFSKSVSMSTSRQFKGSAGDPLFKDTTSADEYGRYRAAFTAE